MPVHYVEQLLDRILRTLIEIKLSISSFIEVTVCSSIPA